MSSTIKLSSGKLIDLSRFVALLPADSKYKLSLDRMNITIELNTEDAEYIHQKLQLVSDNQNSHIKEEWDKPAQLSKNQPLMQLIKQWREQKTLNQLQKQKYKNIKKSKNLLQETFS